VTSQDGDTNTPDLVFFNTNLGVWPIELVLKFWDQRADRQRVSS
jgi:hypothetical protein